MMLRNLMKKQNHKIRIFASFHRNRYNNEYSEYFDTKFIFIE